MQYWGGVPSELVIQIIVGGIGGGIGGVLSTYAIRLVDSFAATARERKNAPDLEIKVVYDGRKKKSFRVPKDVDAARDFFGKNRKSRTRNDRTKL